MRIYNLQHLILFIAVLIVLLCWAGCLAPTPQEHEKGADFHQVTEGYDDGVVFYVIPYQDEPGIYLVDYNITKDGTMYESRSNAVFENISAFGPIIFTVPRGLGEHISLEIEVRNTDGEVLYRSTTVIGPVR
jgi:hypothetical protein